VEVNGSGKYSSLVQHDNNTGGKKFYKLAQKKDVFD